MLSNAEGGGHPSRYDMSRKNCFNFYLRFYTAESNYDSIIAQFNKICGKGNYTTLFCRPRRTIPSAGIITPHRRISYGCSTSRAGIYVWRYNQRDKFELQELLFPRDVFERMADAAGNITNWRKGRFFLWFLQSKCRLFITRQRIKERDVILAMDYSDIGKRYRIILGKTGEPCS